MNLLLLEPCDFTDKHIATIKDHRLQHLNKILSSKVGDTLWVGLLNAQCGQAVIQHIDNKQAVLTVSLNQSPPKPLPLTIILALPRPKMLRRIMRNCAELGIKDIHLINSYKVEKSYWQSPFLHDNAINGYLKEGLMQAKDTIMPNVHFHKRFKPFVEDTLTGIMGESETFVAHPYHAEAMPAASHNKRVIIIGPEGGFIDYEISLLIQHGVKAISMGERIYRVENAVTLLTTQLSY